MVSSEGPRHLRRFDVFKADGTRVGELPSVAGEPPFQPRLEVRQVGKEGFWASIVRPRDFKPGVKLPVIVEIYGASFTTNVFQQMTVAQNLQLPVLARLGRAGRPFARPDRDPEVRAEVESLLSDIGLAQARDTRARVLPHGDQRLLEIGMAIACGPRLCFLDEPCSGMNPGERAKVQELVRRLARLHDVTFVIIEHDMDVVFALSSRVIVMHQGKVLTEGEPEAIRNHAGVKEIYLGEEVGV